MELAPNRQIGRRFAFNLERVSHLLLVYDVVKNNSQIKAEYLSDVLRSAVVLLHASLEDVIRELMRTKASEDPSFLYDHLRFPHPTDPTRMKSEISAAALHKFSGKSVDDVINECVSEHLQRRSFNNKEDVRLAIKIMSLPESEFGSFFDELDEAIRRRHKIVHEGDRVAHGKKTHGRRNHLSEEDVRRWLTVIEGFGKQLLQSACPEKISN